MAVLKTHPSEAGNSYQRQTHNLDKELLSEMEYCPCPKGLNHVFPP